MLMKPRLQTREPRSQLFVRVFSGLQAIARHPAAHFSTRHARVRTTTNFLRTETADSLAGIPAFQTV
jgi:hypothetical protein